MSDQNDANRSQPPDDDFTVTLHERVRESAVGLHNLFISLSTAMVGLYFVVLTQEVKPALTGSQKLCTMAAVAAAGISVTCGLASSYSDAKRHYFWALWRRERSRNEKKSVRYWRNFWQRINRFFSGAMVLFFATGVVCSTLYLMMRIWSI